MWNPSQIPCVIRVICTSKLMSSSYLHDLKNFTFPRNPQTTDIELRLVQAIQITAGSRYIRGTRNLGLLGGFGVSRDSEIKTKRTDPIWVPEGNEDKGRWVESIVYTTRFVLRCLPTFSTRLIEIDVVCFSYHRTSGTDHLTFDKTFIDAKIRFPGFRHQWKVRIGPIPVSSGVAPGSENVQESKTLEFLPR
jgi:hypothetical protein